MPRRSPYVTRPGWGRSAASVRKRERDRKRRWLAEQGITPTDPLRALIASLYGEGQQGAMFIPQPQVLGEQVLFQDAGGTTPVTADGDPVGLMLDISDRGNHATQEVSGARPIYRTDGTLHWLQFDGASAWMYVDYALNDAAPFQVHCALDMLLTGASAFRRVMTFGNGANASQITSQTSDGDVAYIRRADASSGKKVNLGQEVGFYKFISSCIFDDFYINQNLATQSNDSIASRASGKVTIGASAGGSGFAEADYYGIVMREGEAARKNDIENYLASLSGVHL